MTCCGSCDSREGLGWVSEGFKIRQDDTFMVAVPSEFAGWKTGYGPECEHGGGCGRSSGGACKGDCGGGAAMEGGTQAAAGNQVVTGSFGDLVAWHGVVIGAHPGWATYATANGMGDTTTTTTTATGGGGVNWEPRLVVADQDWWCYPSYCPCKDGQKDVKDDINKLFNDAIAAACKGGAGLRKGLESELIGGGDGVLTGIETKVNAAIKGGSIEGNDCDPGGSAPSIVVCGVCIGTDKLGHFVEEGLFYQDIQAKLKGIKDVRPDKVARAVGQMLEGIDPMAEDFTQPEGQMLEDYHPLGSELTEAEQVAATQLYDMNFAGHAIRTSGSLHWGVYAEPVRPPEDSYGGGEAQSSPADLAANEAGSDWWGQILSADCSNPPKFDICKCVTPKWDEGKNPRKEKCRRPGWARKIL